MISQYSASDLSHHEHESWHVMLYMVLVPSQLCSHDPDYIGEDPEVGKHDRPHLVVNNGVFNWFDIMVRFASMIIPT